ncbi:hypothetical protein ACEPAG_4111 [Sanghuangporus baumii]
MPKSKLPTHLPDEFHLPSGGIILRSSDGVEFKVHKNTSTLGAKVRISAIFQFTTQQSCLPETLRQEGYYYAPEPNDHYPSTSDVREQEVLQLAPKSTPIAARIDPNMIDALTDVLHDALGNAVLPEKISETYFLIKRFEQEESKHKVESVQDVRTLVSGSFLTSLFFINGLLEKPFIVSEEGDSARDARSKVDIVIECDPHKRALLELKNPTVFSEAKILLHGSFAMRLATGALNTGRKVINKLA